MVNISLIRSWISFGLVSWVFMAAGCGKRETPVSTTSSPEKRVTTPGETPSTSSTARAESGKLAYLESVMATMDHLALTMTFPDPDEKEAMTTWNGRMTIAKERFATVEHPTRERKHVHLRRWAKVHIVEMPDTGLPRVNRTVESPVTNANLSSDRLSNGWKHALLDGQAPPEWQADLDELDRVAVADASFTKGKTLEPGKSWQLPGAMVARWLGDEITEITGDVNVRVDREETVQGHPCVILKVEVKVAGKLKDEEGKAFDTTIEAKGEMTHAEDLDITLKAELTGTAQLKFADIERKTTVTVQGPLKILESRELR